MQHTSRTLPAALFASFLVASTANAQHSGHPDSPAAKPPAASSAEGKSEGSQELHQTMMDGMQRMQSMQPSGNVDKDFAEMMVMHHQSAMQMAKEQIEHGKSPEMKAMARKMMESQQKEAAQLEQWLSKQK